MGCAGKNRGRAAVLGADLSAEPLHFYLLERVASAIVRDLRIGRRAIDANDDFVDRFRAGCVAVLDFDRINQLDGRVASDILVHCDVLRAAISEFSFCSFAGAVGRRPEHVDNHFCAGGCANDDRAAADRGQSPDFSPKGEKVFPDALERFFKR